MIFRTLYGADTGYEISMEGVVLHPHHPHLHVQPNRIDG